MGKARPQSTRALIAALSANLMLAVLKFFGFWMTGSGSLLAEALHSVADTFNQITLAIGLRESRREANAEHPYGYGPTRWAWAVVSAMGVLFIGAGISVYTGIERLFDPVPLGHLEWAWIALGVAFVLEGASLLTGLAAVRASARRDSVDVLTYLRTGSDPLGVAVVLEDGAAIAGVLIASLALGVSSITGNPVFDAIGSITIGALLATSAIFLVRRNIDLLSGRAPADAIRSRILEVVGEDPVVAGLHDVKMTMVGTDRVRFKAELAIDGAELARRFLADAEIDWAHVRESDVEEFLVEFSDHLVDELGAEIDRIEATIQRVVPQARHIDLEVHRPRGEDS